MTRPKPDRSVQPPASSGYPNPFPSYGDLAQFLVQTGEIEEPGQLLGDRVGLLGDLVLDWIARGQHACQFAKRVAKRLDQPQWLPIVLPGLGPGIPHTLESVLPVAEAETEAVLLIFPGVTTVGELVDLINWLCAHREWYWEEIQWPEGTERERFLLGLRWRLPDDEHESWTLGFGPLSCFPFTRRIVGAPFTVIALRNKWPASNEHPRFGDCSASNVHLAHMPLELPEEEQVAAFCRTTKERRRQFLSDEPRGVSRARITFCLPNTARADLCPPS